MRRALLLAVARSSLTSTATVFDVLRKLAANRDLQIAREFFATPKRPHERQAAIEVVRSGLHGSGVIVCGSISDLGTTVRNTVLVVEEVLSRGWDVCTPEVDTTEPAVRAAIVAAITGLAGLERQGVSDRARAALDRARREGRQLGRKRREIPVDEVQALRAAGRSWREVARETGIPVSSLRTAMKRQAVPRTVALLEVA